MQQTAYRVDEVDGYQLVCFGILSGDIAGRELTFEYSTTSGTACMNVYILCVRGSVLHYIKHNISI